MQNSNKEDVLLFEKQFRRPSYKSSKFNQHIIESEFINVVRLENTCLKKIAMEIFG